MGWIIQLLGLINALLADRSRLALENVALRQQLAVLRRSVNRAKIDDSDRVFWILMRRLCTRRGTFDGLESEILDGVLRESTTPMIALTAESGFREVVRCPIPWCSVLVQGVSTGRRARF